MLQIWWDQG